MRATTRMAPAAPRRVGAQPARHPRTPPAPPCAPAPARPPPRSGPSSRGGPADCLPEPPAGSPGRRRLALRRPVRPLPAGAGERGPGRGGRRRPGCGAAGGAAAEAPRGAPMWEQAAGPGRAGAAGCCGEHRGARPEAAGSPTAPPGGPCPVSPREPAWRRPEGKAGRRRRRRRAACCRPRRCAARERVHLQSRGGLLRARNLV